MGCYTGFVDRPLLHTGYGAIMKRQGTIHRVNPYELHGVRYYQLLLAFADAPDRLHEARLAHDAVYDTPAEGDEVTVEMLLSMITEVRKKEA